MSIAYEFVKVVVTGIIVVRADVKAKATCELSMKISQDVLLRAKVPILNLISFLKVKMINTEAFQNSVSKLVIHPLLWRFTGCVSSIVGFTCYALSPSFQGLLGHWNPLKIVVYSVVSSLLSILMLFVPRCRWRHGKSLLLKAHVGFMVLMLTSLWSILEEHYEEGKVKNGYGKTMNFTSTGAFALMALSLSRQLQLGFEVGVTNFLVGCFLATLIKMSLKLAPIAALFCYLLVNIRSISDLLVQMRARRATQQSDDNNILTLYARSSPL
ncbi:hypothetical protein VNO80_08863 [Phaseolus coccineus]|uniref:Transmembrane protein n=1 Tax=Phaseolus coccineus TaxID=3886 RepID=A0AAN9RBZ2_PHACN